MSVPQIGVPEDTQPSTGSAGRVLIVDDDDGARGAFARVLERNGYEVIAAASAREALAILQDGEIETVVSDISMPDMDGLALILAIRELGLSLPVILATGLPSVETASKAVDHGAFKYLPKPVDPSVLAAAVQAAAVQAAVESDRRRRDSAVFESQRSAERRQVQRTFDAARFRNPMVFIDAAEELGATEQLGRVVRRHVADAAPRVPADVLLFVNLHPQDLVDDELFSRTSPPAAIADRVVPEVTERSSLDNLDHAQERVTALRELGYRIAIDDLGAGYNSLNAVVLLEPDVVKLDMSLVRDVHTSSTKQRMVRAMVTLATELGAATVAEGVETEDERACLCDLGCDLLQGYLFAKPQRELRHGPTPTD